MFHNDLGLACFHLKTINYIPVKMNSEVKCNYTGFKELDLRHILLNSKELLSLIMAVAPLAQTRLPDGGQA